MVVLNISHKDFFSIKVHSSLNLNEHNDAVLKDIIQRYDISTNNSVVEKLKSKLNNTFLSSYGKYFKKLPRNGLGTFSMMFNS